MSSPREEHLLDHLHQVAQGARVPADLAAEFGPDGVRRARQAEALGGLTRLEVPADLAGRVVGATQGGHRQERVTAQLEALGSPVAPAALDALVRREVERPFQDTTTDRPFTAPAELDDRVRKVLDEVGPGTRPATPFTPTLMSVLALAVLIGLALRFGPAQAGEGPGEVAAASSVPSLDALDFEVVPATSDEVARALSTFTGGVWEGSQR